MLLNDLLNDLFTVLLSFVTDMEINYYGKP